MHIFFWPAATHRKEICLLLQMKYAFLLMGNLQGQQLEVEEVFFIHYTSVCSILNVILE